MRQIQHRGNAERTQIEHRQNTEITRGSPREHRGNIERTHIEHREHIYNTEIAQVEHIGHRDRAHRENTQREHTYRSHTNNTQEAYTCRHTSRIISSRAFLLYVLVCFYRINKQLHTYKHIYVYYKAVCVYTYSVHGLCVLFICRLIQAYIYKETGYQIEEHTK